MKTKTENTKYNIPTDNTMLFHGTSFENYIKILNSKYLGTEYNHNAIGVNVTDSFNIAFQFGSIIFELDLPFQKNLIKSIIDTDMKDRELWIPFLIPIHRVKKIWFPDIDYNYKKLLKEQNK